MATHNESDEVEVYVLIFLLCSGSMAKASSQSLFSDQEAQVLVQLLETYLGKMGGATVSI